MYNNYLITNSIGQQLCIKFETDYKSPTNCYESLQNLGLDASWVYVHVDDDIFTELCAKAFFVGTESIKVRKVITYIIPKTHFSEFQFLIDQII